jgi:hypothetical protein
MINKESSKEFGKSADVDEDLLGMARGSYADARRYLALVLRGSEENLYPQAERVFGEYFSLAFNAVRICERLKENPGDYDLIIQRSQHFSRMREISPQIAQTINEFWRLPNQEKDAPSPRND